MAAEKKTEAALGRIESYLNGLLNMASACSDWIGCSEITAACYAPGEFPARFCREFGLKAEEVRLLPVKETLYQTLVTWLGGKNASLTKELCRLIHGELGEPTAILRAEHEKALIDRIGWGDGGRGPYYFTDELFFARFPEAVVCFILGNNE